MGTILALQPTNCSLWLARTTDDVMVLVKVVHRQNQGCVHRSTCAWRVGNLTSYTWLKICRLLTSCSAVLSRVNPFQYMLDHFSASHDSDHTSVSTNCALSKGQDRSVKLCFVQGKSSQGSKQVYQYIPPASGT